MSCKRAYFKFCEVDNCNKEAFASHLCKSHYETKRRYGTVNGPKCQVCAGRTVSSRSIRNKKNRMKMERIFPGTICSKCYFYILRKYVIFLLGNACTCCNEKEPKFLAIDHKYGGGSIERKSTGEKYLYYERALFLFINRYCDRFGILPCR